MWRPTDSHDDSPPNSSPNSAFTKHENNNPQNPSYGMEEPPLKITRAS